MSNALSAIALASSYDILFEDIKKGIKKYKGASRRLEYKGKFKGACVYDDYGHHPTEIMATSNAIHKKAIDYALKKNNLSTDNVTYSDYSLCLVDVIYTDDCMKELQSLVDKKLEEIHKVQAKGYPKKVTVTKKGGISLLNDSV